MGAADSKPGACTRPVPSSAPGGWFDRVTDVTPGSASSRVLRSGDVRRDARRVVADQLRAHAEGHQLLAVEPVIAVQDVLEGLQEEPGPNQHRGGEGDLDRHEQAGQPRRGVTARGIAQHALGRGPHEMPDRSDGKQHTSGQRDGRRECQHREIGCEIHGAKPSVSGRQAQDRSTHPIVATSSPSSPPAAESRRLSVSNWRARRHRPAPIASRTISSRWRPAVSTAPAWRGSRTR